MQRLADAPAYFRHIDHNLHRYYSACPACDTTRRYQLDRFNDTKLRSSAGRLDECQRSSAEFPRRNSRSGAHF